MILWSASALAGSLVMSGLCPGEVTVEMGVTPGGTAVLLSANDLGEALIPRGPCSAQVTGLSEGGFQRRATLTDTDADGFATLVVEAPDAACVLVTQALDLETCELSPTSPLGEPPPPQLIAAEGQASGNGLWAIDPAAGTVTFLGEPGHGYTSLSHDRDGVLHGLTGRTDTGLLELHQFRGTDARLIMAIEPLSRSGLSFESGMTWRPSDQRWWFVDQDGQALVLSADFDVVHDLAFESYGPSFGRDLTANIGGRLCFVNHAELWTVTEDGPTFHVPVTGLPFGGDGNGGAAAWHAGQLYLTESDGEQTWLFIIDTLTGEVSDTGLRIPDPDIDALSSATP